MSEGKKLYMPTDGGGIRFITQRKGHYTIVPNYVFDIWMPLIGAKALGVYATYVRLERAGIVKSLSQADLSKATRIGTRTLSDINKTLEECGFIEVNVPIGYQKTMHYTTEIVIKDPPKEISKEIIEKYKQDSGYIALSHWLVSEEQECNSQMKIPQNVKRKDLKMSNENTNVESLVVESLNVEDSPPDGDPEYVDIGNEFEEPKKKTPHKEMVQALMDATELDMKIKSNAGRIYKASKELREAGYTPEDVIAFKENWKQDWRYKKDGQPPSIAVVHSEIKKAERKIPFEELQEQRKREIREELEAQGIDINDYDYLRKD
jgi:hypothetical protein